jgi:uncharacterized SAM-binding protein YcdF (DUF218 family)
MEGQVVPLRSTHATRGSRSSRRRSTRAIVLAVAAAALLLAVHRAGPWLVVSEPLGSADAIVSLASHEWERLPLVAELAARHPGAVILLTEPQPPTPFNCHDCPNRVDRLRHMGVDETRVLVLPITGQGTHGEALTVRAYARESGVRRLMVATSAYHTRRSLATFRKVFETSGIDIGIEPALDSSVARPSRWWWSGYDRAYVPYEWAAIVHYAYTHGVRWRHLR